MWRVWNGTGVTATSRASRASLTNDYNADRQFLYSKSILGRL